MIRSRIHQASEQFFSCFGPRGFGCQSSSRRGSEPSDVSASRYRPEKPIARLHSSAVLIVRDSGITLVEILVCFFITLVMAGGVYHLIISSKHTAAVAQAKGEAKGMAEVILRALQRDIGASVATVKTVKVGGVPTAKIELSFQNPTNNRWTMLVSEANSSKRVGYEFDAPVLRRVDASGSTRIMCEHVDDFSIATLAHGQIEVKVKIAITPSGLKTPQIHSQNALVTIQQAIDINLDARWRTNNDVLSTY